MKKRNLLPAAMALTLTLSTVFGGCSVLNNPGGNTSENSENSVITNVDTDSEVSMDSDWEKPSETTADVSGVESGNFVSYDGKILFRVNNECTIDNIGLFGKFSDRSYPYFPNSLYIYDPLSSSSPEASFLCNDSGCGELFLVGNTLYSSAVNEDTTMRVTKRILPDGEEEDICHGEINDFSPDGKTFLTSDYSVAADNNETNGEPTGNAYFTVRRTDTSSETGLFFPSNDNYAIFLAMDNEHAFFLKESGDLFSKDSTEGTSYTVYQFDFDGKRTALTNIIFENGMYPVFENESDIKDGILHFVVNSYEGTGNFYAGSADVKVSTDPDDSESDDPLYLAEVSYYYPDNPNEEPESKIVPEEISAFEIPYSSNGSGFARILQYYEELPEGYFFAMCDCHRIPDEDIGWRVAYTYLNSRYYFLPKGSTTPVEIKASYAPAGSKGILDDLEYTEMTPTITVFARFIGTPGKNATSLLYETVSIEGPESPVQHSGVYYAAEFADDFHYEHPVDGDIYTFKMDGMDELIKDYNFSEIYSSSLPQATEYGGYEEKDAFTFENACSLHIGFDKDGRINYIRPVIWD